MRFRSYRTSVKKELTVVSIIVDELSNNENYG